jgi:hypothetical protein
MMSIWLSANSERAEKSKLGGTAPNKGEIEIKVSSGLKELPL